MESCSRFTAAEGGARLAAAAGTRNLLVTEHTSFIPTNLLIEHGYKIRGLFSSGSQRSFYVTRPSRIECVAHELTILTDLKITKAQVSTDVTDWGDEIENKEVVVCTSEVLQYILSRDILKIPNINVLIIDSCHLIFQDEKLQYIMKLYKQFDDNNRPRILALTYPLFTAHKDDEVGNKNANGISEQSANVESDSNADIHKKTDTENEIDENNSISNITDIIEGKSDTIHEKQFNIGDNKDNKEIKTAKIDKAIDIENSNNKTDISEKDLEKSDTGLQCVIDDIQKDMIDDVKINEGNTNICKVTLGNAHEECIDKNLDIGNEVKMEENLEKGTDFGKESKEDAKEDKESRKKYMDKNFDDFNMYEKLEWKIEEMEKELCCEMDLAEDIDSGKSRLSVITTKPKELIVEYNVQRQSVPDDYRNLDMFMKDVVKDALDFIYEHRYDPTEIYGEDLYEEFMNIPDPTIEPKQIFDEFLYVLEQLGPYAADKAAFSLLTKLEKLKIKVPYERHFLLLCLCTSVFVKIRCYADEIFSKYSSDWEKITTFSTPKVLRFAEILEQFRPPNIDVNVIKENCENMGVKNNDFAIDSKSAEATMNTDSLNDAINNDSNDFNNECIIANFSEVNDSSDVDKSKEEISTETINNNDEIIELTDRLKESTESTDDSLSDNRIKRSKTLEMINAIDNCDFTTLGNKIEDRVNTYESNLKDLEVYDNIQNDGSFQNFDITKTNLQNSVIDSTCKNYKKHDEDRKSKKNNINSEIQVRNENNTTESNIRNKNNNLNENDVIQNESSNKIDELTDQMKTEVTNDNSKKDDETTKLFGKRPHRLRGKGRTQRSNAAKLLQMQQNPDALCGIVFVRETLMAKIMFMMIVDMSRSYPNLSHLCAQYCAVDETDGGKESQRQGKKQEDVLKKFRMHECNLLLATPALEEGIDLPRCNLVVRWDTPPSYRSHGLCRGRARAPRAVVLLLAPRAAPLARHLAVYRELDHIITRKCGCGVQNEPSQDEENEADRFTNIVKPYTPLENKKITIDNNVFDKNMTTLNKLNDKDYINKDTTSVSEEYEKHESTLACKKAIKDDRGVSDFSSIDNFNDNRINFETLSIDEIKPNVTVSDVHKMVFDKLELTNCKSENDVIILDEIKLRDTRELRLPCNITEAEMNKYLISDKETIENEESSEIPNVSDSKADSSESKEIITLASNKEDLEKNDNFKSNKNVSDVRHNFDESSNAVVCTENGTRYNQIDYDYLQKYNIENDNFLRNTDNISLSKTDEETINEILNTEIINTDISSQIEKLEIDSALINTKSAIIHDKKIDSNENTNNDKQSQSIKAFKEIQPPDPIPQSCSQEDKTLPIDSKEYNIRYQLSNAKKDDVAFVDLKSAIALINRYCGKLPSDTFTRLAPQWWLEEVRLPDKCGGMRTAYICTLRMPLNCPIKYNIVGHPMPTRVLARRMVALQACRILHKSGELDNQLMPIGKENFKAAELEGAGGAGAEPEPGDCARPGTTKRRQYYYKRTAWAFTNCQPIIDFTDEEIENNPTPTPEQLARGRNSLWALAARLWCALPERYNTRGRRLHAPQAAAQALGLLLARDHPPRLVIPSFPVYTRSGEVRVSAERAPSADCRLAPTRARLIRRFMRFVFSDVLRVRRRGMKLHTEGSTHNNYYVVPTIKKTQEDGTTIVDIDWDFLELIYKHTEEQKTQDVDKSAIWEQDTKDKKKEEKVVKIENPLLKKGETFVFDPEKYKEAVVTPWYRNQDQPQFFLVAEICWNLSPDSAFPSPQHQSFRSYYHAKYGAELTQSDQPLLDVDHTSARLNLLTPRYVNRKGVALPVSSERTRRNKRDRLDQKQILVPELCRRHPFAAPLWFATVALPCVLYRINALLIADEIRRSVAIDVGLGIPRIDDETCPGFSWPPLDFGWSLAEVLSTEEKNDKKKDDSKKEEDKNTREAEDKSGKDDEIEKDDGKTESKEKTINDILQEKEEEERGFEIGTWSNDMASSITQPLEYDELMEPLPPNLTFCTSAAGGANWSAPIDKPRGSYNPGAAFSVADSDCSYMSSDFDTDDSDLNSDCSDDDTDNSGFWSSKHSNAALGVRIEYKTAHEAEAVDLERRKPVAPAPQPDKEDDERDVMLFRAILKDGQPPKQYVEKFKNSVSQHEKDISENYLIHKDKPIQDLLPDGPKDDKIDFPRDKHKFEANEITKHIDNKSLINKGNKITLPQKNHVITTEKSKENIDEKGNINIVLKDDVINEKGAILITNEVDHFENISLTKNIDKNIGHNDRLKKDIINSDITDKTEDIIMLNVNSKDVINDEISNINNKGYVENDKTTYENSTNSPKDKTDVSKDIDIFANRLKNEFSLNDKHVNSEMIDLKDNSKIEHDLIKITTSKNINTNELKSGEITNNKDRNEDFVKDNAKLQGQIEDMFPYKGLELPKTQITLEDIEKNKRVLLAELKKSLSQEEIKKLNCFSMKDIDIDSPDYVNEKVVNVGFDSKEKYEKVANTWSDKTEYKPYYMDSKGQNGKDFDFDYQPDLNGHPGPSPSVILQALTMSNANDGINLERLETIGDSFLKFAITAYLYCAHPAVHEGKLSHMRSKQVSNLNLYRLGRNKRLGARMIASKFEPHDNWLPPCHKPPPTLQPTSTLDSKDQQDMPVDNTGCFIPYNLITQHSIPDKSIADCVEALIGAYLLECGPRGALLFMSWLGIRVLPQHLVPLAPDHPYVRAGHEAQEKTETEPVPPQKTSKVVEPLSSDSEYSSDEATCDGDLEVDGDLPEDWGWPGRPVGGLRPYKENGRWVQPIFGELKAPPSPLLRYIEDPEGELERMLSGYEELERTLGYRFRDRALLLQALTHASHQRNTLTDCYQRLEFLGDAILDYLITRHLYEDARRHSPGALTDLRSALVNNTIFATLAARHGFHKYFRHMSPGLNEVLAKYVKIQVENGHSISEEHYLIQEDEMEQAEDVEVPKALGDLFESVAGAIFLDSGMSLGAVWKSYVGLMGAELEAFSAAAPKSPVRELLEAEPDTAKFGKPERLADGRRVRVCVEVFGRGAFKGIGRNYRIAKGTAARCALRHLRDARSTRR